MKTKEFLTAEWRYLAMINYEIDPAILQPLVPRGTEPDSWQGKTFVSEVGFLFLNTRVAGVAIPFHRNFEEINLRFYVRRKAEDGWRRGVVFVKEIVPRLAIATVARVVYNENYVARRMWHGTDLNEASFTKTGLVEYGWMEKASQNGRNFLRVRATGKPEPLVAGSEEEFITEHYWGYAAQRDGGTVEYRVEHPSWNVWQVSEAEFDCDVERVYGVQFSEALRAKPSSAFVADGSPIIVRKGVKL
ncbi:MAG: YqjF family protein [Blastocatellia bacterium]